MGQMLPAQPEYNFKGVMDAVKIHDYALAPDAVKSLFEVGVSIKNPVLLNSATLVLSPNPAKDILRIQLPAGNEAATQSDFFPGTLKVFDLAGRLVIEQQWIIGPQLDMNIEICKPGVYLLFWSTEAARFAGQFIKI